MISERVEDQIIDQIKRFEENIILPDGYQASVIDDIIAKVPQLMFYIEQLQPVQGISMFFRVETKVRIQYHNTDVNFDDVYAVSTASDVLSLLSRYVGNYKSNLGFVAAPNLDVEGALDEFIANYGVMYPHFTQAQISQCELDRKAIHRFNFVYRIGRVKLNLMESEIRSEVDRVARFLFNDSMPAEAKAYLAHNYLATSIVYYGADVTSNLEKSYVHSAYGALIRKKCVCQGIAEAFKRLMDKAGVACDVVCGKIIGSDEYHAWNIVKLNGADCFHIDATWDISEGAPSFLYFGKNDAFLQQSREWNREYNVTCRSTKNLFMMAKKYMVANKQTLLRQGIPSHIIGV